MAYGMQVFDDSSNLIWDSTTSVGGVIIHVGVYQPTQTATIGFPIFAGRTINIVPDFGWPSDNSVVVDTALGYPRLTVSTSNFVRRFYMVAY